MGRVSPHLLLGLLQPVAPANPSLGYDLAGAGLGLHQLLDSGI